MSNLSKLGFCRARFLDSYFSSGRGNRSAQLFPFNDALYDLSNIYHPGGRPQPSMSSYTPEDSDLDPHPEERLQDVDLKTFLTTSPLQRVQCLYRRLRQKQSETHAILMVHSATPLSRPPALSSQRLHLLVTNRPCTCKAVRLRSAVLWSGRSTRMRTSNTTSYRYHHRPRSLTGPDKHRRQRYHILAYDSQRLTSMSLRLGTHGRGVLLNSFSHQRS